MTATAVLDADGVVRCEITQGEDLALSVSAPGLGADLSGWDAHLQVRDRPGGTVFADLSTGDATISVYGASFTFTVTGTDRFPSRLLVWDLFVAEPGADPLRLLTGAIRVAPAVTVPQVDDGS